MKFGVFHEHQLPRPWVEGAELKLFQDALDQVEFADRLGIDHAWRLRIAQNSARCFPEIAAMMNGNLVIRMGGRHTLAK